MGRKEAIKNVTGAWPSIVAFHLRTNGYFVLVEFVVLYCEECRVTVRNHVQYISHAVHVLSLQTVDGVQPLGKMERENACVGVPFEVRMASVRNVQVSTGTI